MKKLSDHGKESEGRSNSAAVVDREGSQGLKQLREKWREQGKEGQLSKGVTDRNLCRSRESTKGACYNKSDDASLCIMQ